MIKLLFLLSFFPSLLQAQVKDVKYVNVNNADENIHNGEGVPSIIPRPMELNLRKGILTLGPETIIISDTVFQKEAQYLVTKLRPATGYKFSIQSQKNTKDQKRIVLTSEGAKDLGPEGYTLEVNTNGVFVRAKTSSGIFYGCTSLLQLLPPEIFSPIKVNHVKWNIPFVLINDQPYLSWRGFMLDESRHFFGKKAVEMLLDQMALLKFNVFHWHLTDDGGWRIEIRKYPLLTKIGAWRKRDSTMDGAGPARYGGYYTQQDIRDIVAYAMARHITVVPEVDMPGHCAAAMKAYPELAPNNGWKPVIPGIGKGSLAICVAKPQTVQFCKNVLKEIMNLFPSKYIHIGGDEVDTSQWSSCAISKKAVKKEHLKDMIDLQIHFQNKMIAFLESHGRHAIIWNNTYRTTIDKRAINQFWRWHPPMLHALEFAKDGYNLLVSDKAIYYYAQKPALQRAYQYDPLISEFPSSYWSKIKGIEACAWSEHLPDVTSLERSIFPLMFVHSESGWTWPGRKDWKSFQQRLPIMEDRWNILKIDYNKEMSAAALKKQINGK